MFSAFERKIAFKYLRSSKKEGFISVIAGFSFLGISLGVATLIIVLSVMNGFREELLKSIIGFSGHVWVHNVDQPFTNYPEVIRGIEKIPGIKTITPMIERQAIASYQSQARGIVVYGLEGQDLQKRSIIVSNIKSGTITNFNNTNIIIGRRLAEQLHVDAGDNISIISPSGHQTAFGKVPRQRTFKITAVFEVGMHEYDKSVIFMPLQAAQSFFDLPNRITNLEIFAHRIELSQQITEMLKLQLDDHFRVLDWQHSNSKYFTALQVERNVMFLILTLIVLIASFNIISSLIMLVKDKTKDIAILRTMGAQQKSILKIFFLNGAIIGLVGTLLGFLLGVAFSANIQSIRKLIEKLSGSDLFNAEIYFLSQLPAKIDWSEVSLVVFVSISLSFLATLYPSWRAARLDPVEALRQ